MSLPLLPPLNALRAFKVASLTNNFSLAAEELCVSQGGVSRHIAKLEAYLGVRLFDRSNREVRLTEIGAQYAAELQIAFERIEQATLRLHSDRKRDRLKIGVFPSLANTWVMEKLQQYQALNPDLALDIVCQTLFSDVDAHALDIMSMNTSSAREGIEYLPLLNVELTPVCTPEVAERLGGDPVRLGEVTLLRSLRRPDHWGAWLTAAGLPPSASKSNRHFENSALAFQAATAGIGVAMSLTSIDNLLPVYAHMTQPFPLRLTIEESYGFAWRPSVAESSSTAEFLDWLRAQAADRQALATSSISVDQPPPGGERAAA